MKVPSLAVLCATAAFSILTAGPIAAQTGTPIPQAGWSLRFVDSQDLTGGLYLAVNSFDGRSDTFWHTRWNGATDPVPHEMQIDLGASYGVTGFRYLPRQDGTPNGRIAQYQFYVSADGSTWGAAVAAGTLANVATEQQVNTPPKTGRYVRLRALSEVGGLSFASMAEFNVLATGVNQAPDSLITAPAAAVTIAPGQSVTFSGSGTDPENNVPLGYRWTFGAGGPADSSLAVPGPVTFPTAGVYTVAFAATDSLGQADPIPDTRTITVQSGSATVIPHAGWTLRFVDSQDLSGGLYLATNSFDGNTGTFWHTRWSGGTDPLPHEIQIDLAASYSVTGFRYLPRQDGTPNGRIGRYEFYVSTDGSTWGSAVASGSLANVATAQQVVFTAKTGRYVRLRALSEASGLAFTAMAELDVLASGVNLAPAGSISAPTGAVTISPGQSVTFSGVGSDPDGNLPLTYQWDFGAGGPGPSTLASPGAITFPSAGVYAVTFRVTDALGRTDPAPPTRTITVQSPSAASLIPPAGWALWFVDSEETVVENDAAINAFDGQAATFWETRWAVAQPTPPPHEIQIDLGAVYDVSGFRYLPRQDSQFARVGGYEFYVSSDGSTWGTAVAAGTFADTNSSAAANIFFTPKTGRFVRFRALSGANGDVNASIAELGVYRRGTGNQSPAVSITLPASGLTIPAGSGIFLSGSATDPDGNTPLTYRWTVSPAAGVTDSTAPATGVVHFDRAGTFVVTLTAVDTRGASGSAARTVTVLGGAAISQSGWQLQSVDSQELAAGYYPATSAFDGNSATFWHTQFSPTAPPPPHTIVVDLGATYDISGFRYQPRQDGNSNGRIADYTFSIGANSVSFGTVAAGTFTDTPLTKEVLFGATTGRYIRLRAFSDVHGSAFTSAAEIQVLQRRCASASSVRLVEPRALDLFTSSDITVRAEPCLAPGEGVRLLVDGGAGVPGGLQVDRYAAPYSASVTGLGAGEHIVEAVVISAAGAAIAGAAVHDIANPVGVGDAYVAIGDGITFGGGDNNPSDDNSSDGRTATGAGYPGILADRLTATLGRPVTVANEGIPAASSATVLASLPGLLAKYPRAQRFLLFVGHNDAQVVHAPSGLGLHPGNPGYANSFKDNVQRIIAAVNAAGKSIILAKAPPLLPLNGPDDSLMQQYNMVIDELVADPANAIPVAAPDLHAYFALHTAEYADTVLMNGLGYQSMAQLWLDAIAP